MACGLKLTSDCMCVPVRLNRVSVNPSEQIGMPRGRNVSHAVPHLPVPTRAFLPPCWGVSVLLLLWSMTCWEREWESTRESKKKNDLFILHRSRVERKGCCWWCEPPFEQAFGLWCRRCPKMGLFSLRGRYWPWSLAGGCCDVSAKCVVIVEPESMIVYPVILQQL